MRIPLDAENKCVCVRVCVCVNVYADGVYWVRVGGSRLASRALGDAVLQVASAVCAFK